MEAVAKANSVLLDVCKYVRERRAKLDVSERTGRSPDIGFEQEVHHTVLILCTASPSIQTRSTSRSTA